MMMMVTMVGDDRVCNFNNIDVVSRHGDAERTGTGGGRGRAGPEQGVGLGGNHHGWCLRLPLGIPY